MARMFFSRNSTTEGGGHAARQDTLSANASKIRGQEAVLARQLSVVKARQQQQQAAAAAAAAARSKECSDESSTDSDRDSSAYDDVSMQDFESQFQAGDTVMVHGLSDDDAATPCGGTVACLRDSQFRLTIFPCSLDSGGVRDWGPGSLRQPCAVWGARGGRLRQPP
jgi:hypothetical protein